MSRWMRTVERLVPAALVAMGAAACSVPMGRLTVLAIRDTGIKPQRLVRRVEGRDCAAAFLSYFSHGSPVPSLELAVERALTAAPGANALTNVSLVNQRSGIPLLYPQNCLTVTGEAVAVPSGRVRP